MGRVGSDHDGKLCVPNFREGKDDYATKERKTCDLPIQTEPTREKLPKIIYTLFVTYMFHRTACTLVNITYVTMFTHHDMIVTGGTVTTTCLE